MGLYEVLIHGHALPTVDGGRRAPSLEKQPGVLPYAYAYSLAHSVFICKSSSYVYSGTSSCLHSGKKTIYQAKIWNIMCGGCDMTIHRRLIIRPWLLWKDELFKWLIATNSLHMYLGMFVCSCTPIQQWTSASIHIYQQWTGEPTGNILEVHCWSCFKSC